MNTLYNAHLYKSDPLCTPDLKEFVLLLFNVLSAHQIMVDTIARSQPDRCQQDNELLGVWLVGDFFV